VDLQVFEPDMSVDGQWVAYMDFDDGLAADTNGLCDIYLTNVFNGVTTIVSSAADGTQSDGSSCQFEGPVISANGEYVSFMSRGTNLVAGDTNGRNDIFVYVNPGIENE